MADFPTGVRTIEHGSFLTKEAIDLMLEKKAMLIATRSIQVNGVENPQNMPKESYKKLLLIEGENKKSYAAAVCPLKLRSLGPLFNVCSTGKGKSQMCLRHRPWMVLRRISLQSWNEWPRVWVRD